MRFDAEKYLTIFEVIPNPVFIVDDKNRIDNINYAAFDFFHDKLSPKPHAFSKAQISDVLPWLKNELESFLAGRILETTFEKDVETKKGLVHFQIRLKRLFDSTEKFAGVIVILNDISHLKQAERTVARARDFYLTLFEEFPALIWRADMDGKFNYFNQAWLRFTGRTLEDEIQSGWMSHLHEDDLDRCQKAFQEALAGRKPFEMEYRLKRSDGIFRWMLNVARPFRDLEGNFTGYIGSSYDITERKKHEEELSYMATHDLLTGLPNRRVLETGLPRAIAKTERGSLSALLIMDLDRFKDINDVYGHNAGDLVLITLALLLKKQLRESDLLARLGGDEFAVLLEDIQENEGLIIAQRLCESIAQYDFLPDRGTVKISLSVGLALIQQREIPETIIFRTDRAMYKAKDLGGNRIVFA